MHHQLTKLNRVRARTRDAVPFPDIRLLAAAGFARLASQQAVAGLQARALGYWARSDTAARATQSLREQYETIAFAPIHFDPSAADDTGDGSLGRPYKLFTDARLTPGRRHLIAAGTTIAVGSGTWLTTTKTGTAQQPIIIGRYGEGANPKINGAGANRGIRIGSSSRYYRIRDLEFYGFDTGADAYGISVNSVDADGERDITRSIVIERCTVRDHIVSGATTDCDGIKLYGADNEILDCTIYNIGCDAIWFHGYRTLIQGNKIYKVAQDGRNAGDCIQAGANSSYSVVRGNYLDHSDNDYKQCIYFEQTISLSDSVLIEDNYCISYSGSNANGQSPLSCGATNSIVRRNTCVGGIQGILVGENGLAYGNLVFATIGRGMDLKTGARAYHNTIVQTGAQTGQTFSVGIRTASGDSNTEARNNVIIGFANSILVSDAITTAVESNNAFYTTGGTPAHYRVAGVITPPTDAVIGTSAANLGLDANYRPTSVNVAVYTTPAFTPDVFVRPRDRDQLDLNLPRGAYGFIA